MKDHTTVADVADALGVTKNAVMNRIRRGTLTAKKVNGVWRIPRAEYERAVNGAPTDRSQAGDEGGTHGAPTHRARPVDDVASLPPELVVSERFLTDRSHFGRVDHTAGPCGRRPR